MRRIAYCLIVVFGILGCSDLMFAQTPTATSTYSDITTDDATDITSNSATLNATIPLFTTAGAAYFEYGTTSGIYISEISTGTSGKVSARISGLSPVTTYFFRIAVVYKSGVVYGNESSFATLSATATPQATPTPTPDLTPISTPAPCDEGIILETYKATDVTLDSATLNGLIGGNFSVRGILGFEYGTTSGSYPNVIGLEGSDSSNVFVEGGYKSYRVNGLSAGTTYYYRIYKYRIEIIPDFTPCYSYGNEEVFTTCKAVSMTVSPKRLILQRGKSGGVVVTLEGDNCVPEGQTVTATIGKAGSRRISISSASEVTDANGQAKFTITAKNKIGNAKVTFSADSLKKTLTVKVK